MEFSNDYGTIGTTSDNKYVGQSALHTGITKEAARIKIRLQGTDSIHPLRLRMRLAQGVTDLAVHATYMIQHTKVTNKERC